MYTHLLTLLSNNDFTQAEPLFRSTCERDFNDTLAIIGATIYRALGREVLEYDYIRRGLIYNYKNYELYLLLGNYYERYNINQAWLCYENAEFYCDNKEDLQIIRQYKQNIEVTPAWDVHKAAIVILSYNLLDITKGCLESIRANNPASAYELIVVDNNSSDGVADWLRTQSDIKLICNTQNVGFPKGCNQGILAAESDADIFLLNNDTIVPPNALFWLRMGLYENERIGAVGSVSNYATNYQQISEHYNSVNEYLEYARTNNVPSFNPYEKKIYLMGFAVLFKRQAINEIGLLDERFTPGNYEDNDIGLRLQYAGWQVLLCHNSFVYHYGSGNSNNRKTWSPTLTINAAKLKEKYGFNMRYYGFARSDIISLIHNNYDEHIRILEVGCGFGMTLSRIKYMYPNAEVYGIELSEEIARIASNQFDVIQGNIETMELPYPEGYFDYIIFADVLNQLVDPEQTLKRVQTYLKHDGCFLCSIPNITHWSVTLPLLQGKFTYHDTGILDKNNLRFFTLDIIIEMLKSCGMTINEIIGTSLESAYSKEQLDLRNNIKTLPHIAPEETFNVYQYVFSTN